MISVIVQSLDCCAGGILQESRQMRRPCLIKLLNLRHIMSNAIQSTCSCYAIFRCCVVAFLFGFLQIARSAPYDIISNSDSSDDAVREAISSLDPIVPDKPILVIAPRVIGFLRQPPEDASFWLQIGTNKTFSREHRLRAIAALFRRHAVSCHTLRDLRKLIESPDLRKECIVRRVTHLRSPAPVAVSLDSSIIKISIMPKSDARYQVDVWMRLAKSRMADADVHGLLINDERESGEIQIIELRVVDSDDWNRLNQKP